MNHWMFLQLLKVSHEGYQHGHLKDHDKHNISNYPNLKMCRLQN